MVHGPVHHLHSYDLQHSLDRVGLEKTVRFETPYAYNASVFRLGLLAKTARRVDHGWADSRLSLEAAFREYVPCRSLPHLDVLAWATALGACQ